MWFIDIKPKYKTFKVKKNFAVTNEINYYHALYQLKYFGPEGYDVLDDAEIAWYQSVIDAQGVMTGIGERPVGTK